METEKFRPALAEQNDPSRFIEPAPHTVGAQSHQWKPDFCTQGGNQLASWQPAGRTSDSPCTAGRSPPILPH